MTCRSTTHHRPIDRVRRLFAVLALMLLMGPAVHATRADDDWQVLDDHWYILEIAGTPAGWSNEVTAKRGDQIRSISRSLMKIKRLDISIESETSSTFIETADGRPVSFESSTKTGQEVVQMLYSFEEDRVLVTGVQGERRVDNTLPWPEGQWLTPYAATQYFETRRKAGAATIEMRVLMPSEGVQPVGVKSVYQNDQMYEHGTRALPVTHWITETTSMPGMQTSDLISGDGHLVYQEIETGMGKFVTRVAEKDEALKAVAGPAPEMMLTSFITPSRDLDRFLETRTATFEVRVKNGKLPDMPSVGSQRFERKNDTTATITINLARGSDGKGDDKDNPAITGTSVMIDPTDALIDKLAVRAVRQAGDDPMKRAEALRRAAYRQVSRKGYEQAFATASETARTRAGDCSEHAVLLAAMLRAQDIPARVASGLVFVPDFDNGRGIFGWHMWTQALINDQWVDLDATLPGNATFHAGHITTATSTLEDGRNDTEMSSLMLLIGNLEIDVLEYGY